MVNLRYVGRTPDSDAIVAPKGYVDSQNAAAAVTTAWVNQQATAVLPNLTTQSYVDAQNLLLAKQTDVTLADAVFAADTRLNAALGVAGLDSSGNLFSSQIPGGVLSDRVIQSYSLSVPSILFDSQGGIGGLSFTGTVGWGHTCLPGATIIADLLVEAGPVSGISYGGTPMILGKVIGTPRGTLHRYYLQNVPGGPADVNFFLGNPLTWWSGDSVSYLNVGSVGTTTSVSFPYTVGTPGGMAVVCASNDFGPSTSLTGGTIRTGAASSFSAINTSDSNVAVTFTAAGSDGGLATTLNPNITSTGQVGTVNFSGSATVTGVGPPVKLAALLIPDPGYPWRPLPFAWVRGDSSGATNPGNRELGTGSYGLLSVAPPSTVGTQVYGAGICSGSFFTDIYPLIPYAAAGQTPTSVPPINGSMELDLTGSVWSGTSYTFYAGNLVYYVIAAPAL